MPREKKTNPKNKNIDVGIYQSKNEELKELSDRELIKKTEEAINKVKKLFFL